MAPLAPREAKRSVPRAYDLTAERLLILPYAGHDVLFDYPNIGVEVSYCVIQEIDKNLRGRVHRVVKPPLVALYQQQNLDWQNMPVAAIGREFKADKVLYIEIRRFSVMEEGSANLYRGRINAHLQVADTAVDDTKAVQYEGDVSILTPEDHPLGAMDISEAKLRQAMMILFAEQVGWKFYDHEERVVKAR